MRSLDAGFVDSGLASGSDLHNGKIIGVQLIVEGFDEYPHEVIDRFLAYAILGQCAHSVSGDVNLHTVWIDDVLIDPVCGLDAVSDGRLYQSVFTDAEAIGDGEAEISITSAVTCELLSGCV